MVVTYKGEIEALKLESGGATLRLSDPIWTLSGVVDGHVIKANAVTSYKKGNFYISDIVNNRILMINGLTGDVLNILEETNKELINNLFWSVTQPNLIVVHGDKISTYCIPERG